MHMCTRLNVCLCSFATIPYEEIVMAGAGDLSGDEVNALGFLRTPRLLRLGR